MALVTHQPLSAFNLLAVDEQPFHTPKGIIGSVGRKHTNRMSFKYRVRGATHDKVSGVPLAGFTIKIFQKNSTIGEPLGTAITDQLGRFVINFNRPAAERSRVMSLLLHVFNRQNQLVKAPENAITVKAGADNHISIYVFRFEADPNELPRHCFYDPARNDQLLISPFSGVELVEVYRHLRQGNMASLTLNSRQRALLASLQRIASWDDCGEGRYSLIEKLLQERGETELLKQIPHDLPIGAEERRFFTENVIVRYTTDPNYPSSAVTPSTPPIVDQPLRLDRGPLIGIVRSKLSSLHPHNKEVPPTYVQQVGLLAEYALKKYINPPLSFRDPRAGRRRVEVVICELAYATGATSPLYNYIEIAPNNSLVQNFATVPHELFHRVQYRYNQTRDYEGIYGIMREGGARFMEDLLNDGLNRYVFQSQQIFQDSTQSLMEFHPECQNPIRYAAGIFWKYIAEQHSKNINHNDEPNIGVDTYRQLLEATASPVSGMQQPYNLADARTALTKMARPGQFDEFQYLDEAKTQVDTNETTWGNYLVANYLHGTKPRSRTYDKRFGYLEDDDKVSWDVPASGLSPVSKLSHLRVKIASQNAVRLERQESVSRTIIGQLSYAARYYRITPSTSSSPRTLQVSFSAFGGMTDPLIQILRFDSNGLLVDISKSDQPTYAKTVNMQGLSSVVVIVASRLNAGDYTITFDETGAKPDVMITRWNSAVRTEYELDPRYNKPTRTSPDLMVDNDNNREPDRTINPGIDNKLNVRVHNRGNTEVTGVSIELQFQPWASRLDPALWQPVHNAANVTQTIIDVRLQTSGDPRDRIWSIVNWAPPANGSSSGWCIRATVRSPTVRSPRDLNRDNKTAMGCFAQSKVP